MVFGFGLKLLDALDTGKTRTIGHARRSLDASGGQVPFIKQQLRKTTPNQWFYATINRDKKQAHQFGSVFIQANISASD